MERLFETSAKLINLVKTDFKRSLYYNIDWEQKLIEIIGSRGVGKTTLMLQKAKELLKVEKNSVVYFSLDDPYFFNNTIIETVEYLYKYGVKYIFFDEVHKYPPKHKNYDWSSELKNIYDLYPDLNVIYSGSSIIAIYKGNGDLSRRKNTYMLNGLSFREYLEFNNLLNLEKIDLNDIIDRHIEISNEIVSQIKIIPIFKEYLKNGYYPFYNDNPAQYYQKIRNIINVITEVDIPSVAPDINFNTISKIKKLLMLISSSVPYTPNLTNLSNNLNVSDIRTLYRYLGLLQNAELLFLLSPKNSGKKILQKPEKIFMNNVNLIYAINSNNNEIGTIRETFFCNQLSYLYSANYPEKGDFLIDNKYVFEVGGKNKNNKQIKTIEKSFVVIDDIEIGFSNRIPIWIFGLLY